MATRIKIPLVGGDYAHPSTPFDAQQTINMFPERGGAQSKAGAILRRWPGLLLFKALTLSTGPIRGKGMYESSNHRLFVIRASALIEVDAAGTETSRGTLSTSFGPVSMTDNGFELVIADGTKLYQMVFSTNVLTIITDGSPPSTSPVVDFVDGYIFGFNPDSAILGEFQHSELRDANSWSSLDTYNAESSPDKMVSLIANSGKIWAFGSKSFEVWFNTGAATGTWNRLSGTPKDIGCASSQSVAKMSGHVFWLGASKEGRAIIYMSQGYEAVEISTKPLESWINSVSDVSDAIGFTMQIEGHFLYMITFQTGDRTYVYDMTENEWFRVAYRNTETGEQGRYRILAYAFFNNKNLVGDFSNGNIYELDINTFTDNGDPQVCERYFPYFQDTKERIFWRSLQIDVESGVGLSNDITFNSGGTGGASPEIQLRWSNNGGRSFGDWHEMAIGEMGEYLTRAKFNRLGISRDRVYHVRCSSPVRFNIIDDTIAEVDFGSS